MSLYFNLGDIVKFKPHSPAFPHLDGFTFKVVDIDEQGDADHDHVWLECVENKGVEVKFYVNTTDLESADGH